MVFLGALREILKFLVIRYEIAIQKSDSSNFIESIPRSACNFNGTKISDFEGRKSDEFWS